MSERHGAGHGLTDHELSEIRMLIEERTGIHFDESRERFLSTRVREHMHERGYTRVSELLRAVRKTNVEYDSLLERMLTQETSFFRYPAVFEAFEKRVYDCRFPFVCGCVERGDSGDRRRQACA